MSTFHKELYSDMILEIKCGSYQGRKIKAKPGLLYSVIIMIEEASITDNRIYFNKSSEEYYKNVFTSIGEDPTPFFKPFYYMQFDGLWHLKGKTEVVKTNRPSPKYIRENVEYAFLDYALGDLLQEAEIREHFKSIIKSHFFNKY